MPAAPSFAAACAVAPSLSLRVLPQVGAAINDYYSNHPQFLWIDDGAVDDKARAVMAALALSGRYGLTPADYRVALPPAATGDKQADLKAALRFELTLSAKVLTYVLDATRGRVDPNRMSDYYDLPRKNVDLAAALGEIAKAIGHRRLSRQPQSRQRAVPRAGRRPGERARGGAERSHRHSRRHLHPPGRATIRRWRR